MTAALILPCARRDDGRERRLVAAWLDPELSISDLKERGYNTGDFNRARRQYGAKAVMPMYSSSSKKGERR